MDSIREDLLAAVEPPRETVDVPELRRSFTLRGMTGEERDAFELSLTAQTANGRRRVPDPKNYRAKLLVFSIIDPDSGERMFADSDVAALGRVRADVLSRLSDVAQRLSGLRPDDVEAAEKN